MTIGAKPEPEIERRRRQLEVITKKIERAQHRKDEPGAIAAREAFEATEARIAALEANDTSTPPRRSRRGES